MITENLQKEGVDYERHDVENTPFSIIKEIPKGDCVITVGKNIITQYEFPNIEKAKEYIEEKNWDMILNCMALMATNIFTELQKQKGQNND